MNESTGNIDNLVLGMNRSSMDNLRVGRSSMDSSCVSGKSEYEDEYVVPMNVVDMTHGVQYNIGQPKNVRKPSFLRSIMVSKDNGEVAGGGVGGSTPSTARGDRSSFRSLITNVVRRSFANGPTGVESPMVIPTDDMVTVTTAQKMEMLNTLNTKQHQQ